jgi:AraC-like DNA-binding protein
MVKGTRAEQHEAAASPVIAVGNEYPAGHRHPAHRHRRAQLLYAEYGTMAVDTDEGEWVVPPQEALWIPSSVRHGFTMLSKVATRSVYFDAAIAAHFSNRCQVVSVSPLLRQLLIEAADLPIDYDPQGRDGKIVDLIVEELRRAPVLPFYVPIPDHARLAGLCRRFAAVPTIKNRTESWSAVLGMSRRSFTRLFRRATGLSLAAWQRRACVRAALTRLSAGESVTAVAFDLGYSSPAAFTAMFTRTVGAPPSRYAQRR